MVALAKISLQGLALEDLESLAHICNVLAVLFLHRFVGRLIDKLGDTLLGLYSRLILGFRDVFRSEILVFEHHADEVVELVTHIEYFDLECLKSPLPIFLFVV